MTYGINCLPGNEICLVCLRKFPDLLVYRMDNSPLELRHNGISTAAYLSDPLVFIAEGYFVELRQSKHFDRFSWLSKVYPKGFPGSTVVDMFLEKLVSTLERI